MTSCRNYCQLSEEDLYWPCYITCGGHSLEVMNHILWENILYRAKSMCLITCLTLTRLQPPPPPPVPAPPPPPPDISLSIPTSQTIHAPPSVPTGISTTPRLSSSEPPAAQSQTTPSTTSLRKISHTANRPTRKTQKPPYLTEFHSGSISDNIPSDNIPTTSGLMRNLTRILSRSKSN